MARKLTEAEVEESLNFANGAMAAAGHSVTDPDTVSDIRSSLYGDMTREEYMARLYDRVMRA